MQSNSHVTKFNKVNRFSHEEAQERLNKGKKLNKVKRQNKRDLWFVDSIDEV